MSCAIDVNLLLYASDRTSALQPRAARFLADRVAEGDLLCLSWSTLVGYLRMATHPGIFAQPLSPDEAMQNVEALLRLPNVRVLVEQEGFWDVYRVIAHAQPIRGNLVPDAHLAALLRQHGVRTLYSNDRDFLKFDFLDVRNPFR